MSDKTETIENEDTLQLDGSPEPAFNDADLVKQVRANCSVDQWEALQRKGLQELAEAREKAYNKGFAKGCEHTREHLSETNFMIPCDPETLEYLEDCILQRIENTDYPEQTEGHCHLKMLSAIIKM